MLNFHHFINKFPLNLPQNLPFFDPDFVPQRSPSKFWARYLQNHVPKHARAQNLVQIGAFRLQDTFNELKWAKNAQKGKKKHHSVNFEGTNELKIILKPTFPI